jgi:hypothetical protein
MSVVETEIDKPCSTMSIFYDRNQQKVSSTTIPHQPGLTLQDILIEIDIDLRCVRERLINIRMNVRRFVMRQVTSSTESRLLIFSLCLERKHRYWFVLCCQDGRKRLYKCG